LFRKAFAEAKKLIEAQKDWCYAAENLYSHNDNDQLHLDSRFPEDLKLESLTALLRRKVKLNIHCYETHDIEAMIRHANEFDFDISALHHALEAYRIPDIIKRARNNITVATFADNWGYKKEAYGASPEAPKLLFEAGIPVALKSDHPVLNSQHMAFEAAKAVHYGLPEQEAFKSITSVPAKALGLDHRVGSLKEGYDADVVIWDRSPLALGAAPLQVFVDGVPLFDEKPIEPIKKAKTEKPVISFTTNSLPKEGTKSYILINIGTNYLQNTSSMVIEDGRIICYQSNVCTRIKSIQFETIDLQGGFVLPVSQPPLFFQYESCFLNILYRVLLLLDQSLVW
jgi:imidazolonepropionase-like amidohydrolase